MKHFKLIDDLPKYDNLLSELKVLLDKKIVEWPTKSVLDQLCINTVESEPDNYLKGVGSLVFDWTKITVDDNDKMHVPRLETRLKETDFNTICTQFRGTVFEEIYHTLSEKFYLGRVRLMRSKPKTCLSWHTDETTRIHYPIKTQPGCFMIIGDELLHLEQDTWWWTNTNISHTALNSSKEDRIHLVAVVLKQK